LHGSIITGHAAQLPRQYFPSKEADMSGGATADDLIEIRIPAAIKAILNRAATLRGQTLSEFMLDSARARAEETILDQRLFALDDASYRAFLVMLDAPAKPDKTLRARMKRKSG
jgi:uncharacterized protein (DUF1778 family)